MITTREYTPFEAFLYANQAGLAPALGVTITSPSAGPVSPRYTGVRVTATPNIYAITLIAPPAPADPSTVYLLVWDGGGVDAVEELQVAPIPSTVVGFLPTADDVAVLERARTRTDAGELGEFTSQTRPTLAQVNGTIKQAGEHVAAILGPTVPVAAAGMARGLVSLFSAMLIELTYFPEQVNTNRSPYAQWRELFDLQLPHILSAVEEATEGDIEAGTGDLGFPSYGGFPATAIGMEHPW